jgi:hypothetical protein
VRRTAAARPILSLSFATFHLSLNRGGSIVIVKISKIAVLACIVTLAIGVRPARCEGWSLLDPFGSGKKDTTPQRYVPKTQPEPSLWDKTSAGTKNILNKTGETLGLKKPTVKKPTMAYAKPPKLYPKAKDSPSWFAKMFQPEEKKPKTVGDWMKSTSQIVPAGGE